MRALCCLRLRPRVVLNDLIQNMESESLVRPAPMVNSLIDTIGFGRYQLIAIAVASISTFADGLEIGLLSVIAPTLQSYWNLSDTEIGMVGFIALSGLPMGAGIAGTYSDRLGRLVFIKWATILLFISSVASAFMPDPWSFACTRLIVNASIGALVPAASSYVSELSPAHLRGRLMYATFSFYYFGKIAAILIILAIMPDLEESNWRLAVFVLSLPSGIAIPLIYAYLVETPYLLLQLGRKEEAVESINYIMKINKLPELTEEELAVYTNIEVHDNNEQHLKRIGVLFRPPFLTLLILCTIIQFVNAFVGTELKFILPFTLKKTVGKSFVLLGLLLYELLVIPALISGYFVIDWEQGGRKIMMIASHIWSIVFLIVCVIFVEDFVFIFTIGLAHAGLVIIYNTSLAYSAEIFPTKVRSIGVAIPFGFSRILCVIAPIISLKLDDAGLEWPYIFAIILTVVGLAATFLLPIETRGMALDSNNLKEASNA
mmetsp:Transcript_32304/g.55880  ORF Transcript_32304/g.55880 Transcript_32304/m.55880 type:complete len:488 (-) Transcript_32304:65-1528(-)